MTISSIIREIFQEIVATHELDKGYTISVC